MATSIVEFTVIPILEFSHQKHRVSCRYQYRIATADLAKRGEKGIDDQQLPMPKFMKLAKSKIRC